MAKSDCGLPARSNATKMLISQKEWEIRYDYACGNISRSTYYRKLRKLKEKKCIN